MISLGFATKAVKYEVFLNAVYFSVDTNSRFEHLLPGVREALPKQTVIFFTNIKSSAAFTSSCQDFNVMNPGKLFFSVQSTKTLNFRLTQVTSCLLDRKSVV